MMKAMDYLEGMSTEEFKDNHTKVLGEQSEWDRTYQEKINEINFGIEEYNKEYRMFRQKKGEASIHFKNRKEQLKRSKNYYDVIYILM